ncbi:MAG: TetR family transcriptional regulator [bacterium]|nr:TetR family transcriptional regulator [bacterium]
MTSAFADPPITPKAAATRARLLDIAAVVFIEHGYAAVSLRDIAKVAGVTKGAIYGHFRSKGQLLVEVIRTQLAERDARFDMDAAAEQPMTAFVQFINPDSRDLRLLQIDAAAAARHDLDVAAGLEEIYAARSAWILDTLRRLDSPETLLYIINALSAGVGAQEAHGRIAPDPNAWSNAVARLFGVADKSKT